MRGFRRYVSSVFEANQNSIEFDTIESEVSEIAEMIENGDKKAVPVINTLKSFRAILEGAAGDLLASGVVSKIPEVIAAISAG